MSPLLRSNFVGGLGCMRNFDNILVFSDPSRRSSREFSLYLWPLMKNGKRETRRRMGLELPFRLWQVVTPLFSTLLFRVLFGLRYLSLLTPKLSLSSHPSYLSLLTPKLFLSVHTQGLLQYYVNLIGRNNISFMFIISTRKFYIKVNTRRLN